MSRKSHKLHKSVLQPTLKMVLKFTYLFMQPYTWKSLHHYSRLPRFDTFYIVDYQCEFQSLENDTQRTRVERVPELVTSCNHASSSSPRTILIGSWGVEGALEV